MLDTTLLILLGLACARLHQPQHHRRRLYSGSDHYPRDATQCLFPVGGKTGAEYRYYHSHH